MSNTEFTGFESSDFDAYQKIKWKSNIYTRERITVREKLEAFGRSLFQDAFKTETINLCYETSADHPTLWNQRSVSEQTLFISRNENLKKELFALINKERTMASLLDDPSPLKNHIHLYLTLDEHSVHLGLTIHSEASVDKANLQNKCEDFFRREKLLDMLQELPNSFQIRIGKDDKGEAKSITDDTLQEILAGLSTKGNDLNISCMQSKEDVLSLSDSFNQWASDAFSSLLPVLQYIAWSRDNDHQSIVKKLEEKVKHVAATGAKKHDKVKVTAGLFAGQIGTITEIDKKGNLKIQVGKMVVSLPPNQTSPMN